MRSLGTGLVTSFSANFILAIFIEKMAEVDRMLRAELGGLSEMHTELDPWGSETTLPDIPHYLSRRLSSLFESAPLESDAFGYSPSLPDIDSLSSSFGDISVGSPHSDHLEAPLLIHRTSGPHRVYSPHVSSEIEM
jgi:hypothetical protein